MDIDRLAGIPVPLRYAAVKQQLTTNGGSTDLFDRLNKLLSCRDEVC